MSYPYKNIILLQQLLPVLFNKLFHMLATLKGFIRVINKMNRIIIVCIARKVCYMYKKGILSCRIRKHNISRSLLGIYRTGSEYENQYYDNSIHLGSGTTKTNYGYIKFFN